MVQEKLPFFGDAQGVAIVAAQPSGFACCSRAGYATAPRRARSVSHFPICADGADGADLVDLRDAELCGADQVSSTNLTAIHGAAGQAAVHGESLPLSLAIPAFTAGSFLVHPFVGISTLVKQTHQTG